jgi:hypothetical protein
MKKHYFKLILFIILTAITINTSCKKEKEITSEPEINMFALEEAYNSDEAAVIMTLAAIAYTEEGSGVLTIKNSMEALLNDPSLKTKGRWELVWGPGVTSNSSNLIYIAKYDNEAPATYAMVVRGTSIYSLDDIHQDVEVFELVPFTYGITGDSVAKGSMDGLDLLLQTSDPVSGKTIMEFLPEIVNDSISKMFITGHSQGGALAPLLAYWFITSSGVNQHFQLETYAFAGPSVGNESFVQNFFISQPENAYFSMVANSLDIVPYFWARFDSLVPMHIPAPVPLVYRIFLTAARLELNLKHINYIQLDNQIDIGSFTPIDTIPNIHPSDTLNWFNKWVWYEHTHNSYLTLLGAKPI